MIGRLTQYVPDVCRVMPVSLYRDLSALELRIVMLLWRLMRSNSCHGRTSSPACMPSEIWIGAQVGAHPKSVSRALRGLVDRGILVIRQTRTSANQWSHNVYRMGAVLISLVVDYCRSRWPGLIKPGNISGEVPELITKKDSLNGASITSYINRMLSRTPWSVKNVNKVTTYNGQRQLQLLDGRKIDAPTDRQAQVQLFKDLIAQGLLA